MKEWGRGRTDRMGTRTQRKSVSSGDRKSEVAFGMSGRQELEEKQAASCLKAPRRFRDFIQIGRVIQCTC